MIIDIVVNANIDIGFELTSRNHLHHSSAWQDSKVRYLYDIDNRWRVLNLCTLLDRYGVLLRSSTTALALGVASTAAFFADSWLLQSHSSGVNYRRSNGGRSRWHRQCRRSTARRRSTAAKASPQPFYPTQAQYHILLFERRPRLRSTV